MLQGEFEIISKSRREMIDLSGIIQDIISTNNIAQGHLILFNPHTTAGLTINEGADPDVQKDLLYALTRIVPDSWPFRHAEGNSPAHVMATLVGSSVTVLINNSRPRLGVWQSVYFCEFDGPRKRKVFWMLHSNG
jgi:secondary thiamine-phosphate synthase enzyme